MQVWAWASMLSDRIPEQGIEQAFDSTFSGDFPCEKCRAIAEFKAKEADQHSSTPQPPTTDSNQIAKLIGIISNAKSAKIYASECTRIPFLATHLRAPTDFIITVPSPPPQVA